MDEARPAPGPHGRVAGAPPTRVVLGFDGSPRAWASLRVAEQEAVSRGALLELLAVLGRASAPLPRHGGRGLGRSPGGSGDRDAGPGLSASIGAARRMVMVRQPGLDVAATVLLTEDVEGHRPLHGADLLVLGWSGGSTDLVTGLGAPGARLVRAADVPVLVAPPGTDRSGSGPVVLLLTPSTTRRTFEVAAEEARRRAASMWVAQQVSDVEGESRRLGAPSVVVVSSSRGGTPDGLREAEVAGLFRSVRVPVLLVPPAEPRLPGPRLVLHDDRPLTTVGRPVS